ncbi:hypothetical protein Trco_002684 [Trichoderma cornu-damae]|uniref:Uncharacterized protein n=1 Tax=Trichoderma cornu-damae TaxID=654480 RepID=A0A9P8TY88_9HYPO|nr:hypothetical protein Trco_002684 [Trichoderma cornu-damae]
MPGRAHSAEYARAGRWTGLQFQAHSLSTAQTRPSLRASNSGLGGDLCRRGVTGDGQTAAGQLVDATLSSCFKANK